MVHAHEEENDFWGECDDQEMDGLLIIVDKVKENL